MDDPGGIEPGGITAERLDQVVAILARAGISHETIGALRQALAPIHFTWCQDDDLGDGATTAPARSAPTFKLYLVDGRDHCMRLTTDPESATGILVAELDPAAA